MKSIRLRSVLTAGSVVLGLGAIPLAAPASATTGPGTNVASVIVSLAKANVGKGDCSKNSLGSKGFETSCAPEYWCADFAKWVWVNAGISDHNSQLTPAAYSFYSWAKANGQFSTTPAVGDVAIFANTKGDNTDDADGIHHVAIVTAVSGSDVKLISGDWGGDAGSQAVFANSSSVVENDGGASFSGKVGSEPPTMSMYIIGYAIG